LPFFRYILKSPMSNADKTSKLQQHTEPEESMTSKLQLAGRMRGALRVLVPAALKIAGADGELEPIEHNGLRAQCCRDWPGDSQFIDRWNALLARNSWATVFNSPAWQSAVVNQFVPAGLFRLITVNRQDELLAVLPLALNTASMLETPGRHLSDYLDPLIDAQTAEPCWEIILSLLAELWDWSVGGVQFHHVRATSVMRQILPTLAPKFGFEYREFPVTNAPYLELPKTWDEYLASIDSHERKEIRRKVRNAQTKGNLQWLTHRKEDEVVAALERALSAMRQSDSLKADFTDEVLVGFLRGVCPILARQGDFYIQELVLENNPSAWLLTFRSERGPMIYNTAYDFAQRQWSPGIVSFAMSIQDAIAAGAPIYNFLRGAEDYKDRLGAKDLQLLKIQLIPT
jgi:CelD/BcsL family acetyltransferase involved in cellulose biosynthesis